MSDNADEPAGPTDDLTTSTHTLSTPSGEFAYTVRAGRIVLREEMHGSDGSFEGHRPRAELFVAAYTRDHADAATRPVTFAFNGGPGSSSIWLHMGLLGPRRVLMGDAGELLPPPYGIADNAETLLADSDLVFIDPVSTGFSRVAEGGKPDDYHGYARDLDAVGEVIRLWTSRNDRWMSPKFLAGESYGTLRAAALADHLESRYGLFLNGIMLISSVLDMGTIRFTEGNDLPYTTYLPTYACLAHYHGITADRPLQTVRADAEEFAARDYPFALAQGARLPRDERDGVLSRLARLTGLSTEYLDRADLRVEHQRFFRELLRDRGQTIGRLDGRFTGWEADDSGERGTYDPSYAAIHGPYAAAWGHYVRGELRYRNDLPYEILTSRVQPWSYREFEGRHVSVSSRLAAAMRHNPHLRIYLGCGYYDGATPYAAAEHTFAHLALPAQLRERIQTRYYEAGHMMYVHEPSRLAQSAHLAAFVRG
ncbi:MAG TPA: peptidase S10 [Mycobacteriales bacterium]|nr:peptidase S10 [Mycobacteriales bacterium]